MGSWIYRNSILQVRERYVVGFSFKLDQVITTKDYLKAKRFKPLEVQEFIRLHGNELQGMPLADVRIHLIKAGQKFQPKGVEDERHLGC